MGSFEKNHSIAARSKHKKYYFHKPSIGISTILLLATLTSNCSGCCPKEIVASVKQNINASTPSTDNNFYETTTSDSTLTKPDCQDVSSFCLTKECLQTALDLMRDMDLTADPCEDFYQYTCGKWAENHPK